MNRLGGITEARRVWALGETFGLDVIPHLGFAHNAHLAITSLATPLLEYMPPAAHPDEADEDQIFWVAFPDEPRAANGHVTLSERPGLGVTLDRSVLEPVGLTGQSSRRPRRSSVSSPASSRGIRSRSFAARASAAARTSARLTVRDDDDAVAVEDHDVTRRDADAPDLDGNVELTSDPLRRPRGGDRACPHGEPEGDELVEVPYRPVDEDRRRAAGLRLDRDQVADDRHRSLLRDRQDEHVARLDPLERPVRGQVVRRSAGGRPGRTGRSSSRDDAEDEPASRPAPPAGLERRRDAELGEPRLGRHGGYQSPTLPSR